MISENWEDLELFERKRIILKPAAINIGKNLTLTFNQTLKNTVDFNIFNNVRLFYSKQKNSICFEFTNGKEESIKLNKGKITTTISVKSFIKVFDLEIEKIQGKHLLEQKIINGNTVWVAKLNDE